MTNIEYKYKIIEYKYEIIEYKNIFLNFATFHTPYNRCF